MPKITFNQAKEFLKKISRKDKVAIIHDTDMDGVSSAILAYDYCIKAKVKTSHFAFFRGSSSLNKFDLKKFNKIIILDIGTNLIQEAPEALDHAQVLYIDHHPRLDFQPGNNIQEYRTIQDIPTVKTIYELIKEKKWLAVVGTISDAGDKYQVNKKFLKDFIKKTRMTEQKFKEKYVWKFGSLLVFFDNNLDKAFDILKELKGFEKILDLKQYWEPVEKEVKKTVKDYYKKKTNLGHINLYTFKSKFKIKSIVINKISYAHKNKIFIFITPLENNKIGISARNQSGKYDTSKILIKATKNLKESTVGGHPPASAAVILAKDLLQFKENIKNFKR